MKTLRIATVALCMLLLVLPSVAIPIFQPAGDDAENRYLADPPVLADADGLNQDFDEDFEDWLRDHFAFRRQAIGANALLNYRLLRTSPNESVVVGEGDWLYFADTVPDYTGEGRLSEDELRRIGDNLSELSEALASRGAALYVAIIPNKNTVYPDYMPARYAMRDGDGNIPLMREACEARGIPWIDLLTPLREAAEGDPLIYYRTDTHWNALGVAIAADALLEGMGRVPVGWSVDGEAVFRDGDLARLMGLPGQLSEAVPAVAPSAALPDADFSEHRLTVRGDGEDALLVYRDSFGTAAGPWLSQAFERTELRWEYPLNATRPCDAALLLLCERNLREYLLPPPVTESDGENLAEEDEDNVDWDAGYGDEGYTDFEFDFDFGDDFDEDTDEESDEGFDEDSDVDFEDGSEEVEDDGI